MIRFPIPLLCLVLGSGCLSAAEALVITLYNIPERVRAQNPDLRAARLLIDEAAGRAMQAGRLENPSLGVGVQQNDQFNERGIELSLTQKLPVTARLKLEKDQGVMAVEAARREVEEVGNRLAGEARECLVEVLALRERRELLQRQAMVAGKLAEFSTEAAKRGEVSPIAAGQAGLEASRLETECLQMDATEQRLLGKLKPLLGMSPDQGLQVSGSLPGIDLPAAAPHGKRAAIDLAKLEIQQAEQQTAIEKANRREDIEIGVFAGLERVVDAPTGADREAIVGLKLSVPLPLWDRNEGNIQASEATAERRRAELAALEARVGLEATSLRDEMQQWAALAGKIDSGLLPLAARQTSMAEQSWKDGQLDLLSVLKSREQEIQLAIARVDALKNFHLARVRHQTVLGLH